MPQIEVNEVFRLVGHVRPKVAAHNAVPCGVVLLVELLLDIRGNVLRDTVCGRVWKKTPEDKKTRRGGTRKKETPRGKTAAKASEERRREKEEEKGTGGQSDDGRCVGENRAAGPCT